MDDLPMIAVMPGYAVDVADKGMPRSRPSYMAYRVKNHPHSVRP